MGERAKISADAYVSSGKHLPPIMRDFHDCKDLFKNIHRFVAVDKHDYARDIPWTAGQCYVIDIFLWFMAKRGWTLQRSRAAVDFLDDLDAMTDARRDEEAAAFREILARPRKTEPTYAD